MIYWFYGQPGAGKTTLGNCLQEVLKKKWGSDKIIRIDGDEMRLIFKNQDYSEEGRRNNLKKVNDLIRFLYHKNYTVIVSVVAPYQDIRNEIHDLDPMMIYTYTSEIRGREKYHTDDMETGKYDIWMNTDNRLPIQCINEILTLHR